MDIKKLIVTATIIFFATTCNAEEHAFKKAKERTLFKNMALSMCLGMGYDKTSSYLTDQFSQAMNGYREFSNISPDAYDDLRTLIKKWLGKNYLSKNGDQNIVMKCIDLSNSNELDILYDKYDPCKKPDSWLESKEYHLRCR